MNSTEKPPLGVVPRQIFLENRLKDLGRAVSERASIITKEDNFELISIWVEEMSSILDNMEIEIDGKKASKSR